jgi:hypothetical protein
LLTFFLFKHRYNAGQAKDTLTLRVIAPSHPTVAASFTLASPRMASNATTPTSAHATPTAATSASAATTTATAAEANKSTSRSDNNGSNNGSKNGMHAPNGLSEYGLTPMSSASASASTGQAGFAAFVAGSGALSSIASVSAEESVLLQMSGGSSIDAGAGAGTGAGAARGSSSSSQSSSALVKSGSEGGGANADGSNTATGGTDSDMQILAEDGAMSEIKCSAETTKSLFGHFLTWVQNALMDDIAMHVHEADRTDFEYKHSPRRGSLQRFVTQYCASVNAMSINNNSSSSSTLANLPRNNSTHSSSNGFMTGSASTSSLTSARGDKEISVRSMAASTKSIHKLSSSSPSSAASLANGNSSNTHHNFVAKMRTINNKKLTLKEQNKSKNRKIRNQDSSLTAELRNVIVMFISVKMDASQLLISPPTADSTPDDIMHPRIKSFHFLTRSAEEYYDDQRLMNSFQDCMHIMTKIFKDHGGQMRQFIVDDKGTTKTNLFFSWRIFCVCFIQIDSLFN